MNQHLPRNGALKLPWQVYGQDVSGQKSAERLRRLVRVHLKVQFPQTKWITIGILEAHRPISEVMSAPHEFTTDIPL